MKRWSLVSFIAIFLTVSLCSHIGKAEAATSRVAIISKIEGTVDVQKSGGKKTLKGFKGMSLNQGDVVTTGKKSSVILKFSNGTSEDDTFILESSTKVTFSKLSNKKGTTTKVSMLQGKVWVDVKSIKNEDDDFVLETPTAIMGVRGTNFFVGVNPNTGLPSLAVLSGNVNVVGSDNNNNGINVYPASGLTVGNQGGLEMIPIDNQVLAQMLTSTSKEVMQAILESAQKIINENKALLDRFSTTNFPTEINQLPLSENEYTDNVYNLLLALAQEAFKLHKLDGTQLLELQQKIKEQQLTNNELHHNQGDVDWKFEVDALSEQKRLEKLKAEQAKKDALKNSLLAEQKAKEDKLKQDRLDALEKLYLEKLSQAEREKYEREKQDRLEELAKNQPTPVPPSTPAPTDPPEPIDPPLTWSDIEKPFKFKLGTYGSATPLDLNYEQRGDIYTDLIIEDPVDVTADGMYIQFEPSTDSSLEILGVSLDGIAIDEEVDNDGNGNGIYRWFLESNETELSFVVTVKHNELDEKDFNLSVQTIVPTVFIEPINIYQGSIAQEEIDQGNIHQDFSSNIAVGYTITEGNEEYDYVITISSLDFTSPLIQYFRFEKKNYFDEILLWENVGGEWKDEDIKREGELDYIHYPSPSLGANTLQYKLEHSRDIYSDTGPVIETYLINVLNVRW